MWPADKIDEPTTMIESLEEDVKPRNKTVQKPVIKKGPKRSKTKQKTTPKPSKSIFNITRIESTLMQVTTEMSNTQFTTEQHDGQTNKTINGTDSILDSFRNFGKNHPQVITSIQLTLIPIAVVGAFFVVL